MPKIAIRSISIAKIVMKFSIEMYLSLDHFWLFFFFKNRKMEMSIFSLGILHKHNLKHDYYGTINYNAENTKNAFATANSYAQVKWKCLLFFCFCNDFFSLSLSFTCTYSYIFVWTVYTPIRLLFANRFEIVGCTSARSAISDYYLHCCKDERRSLTKFLLQTFKPVHFFFFFVHLRTIWSNLDQPHDSLLFFSFSFGQTKYLF